MADGPRYSRYFGEPWGVPALAHAIPVSTPIGQPCLGCGECVADGDRGWMRGYVKDITPDGHVIRSVVPIHAECELRSVVGHMVGVCRCTGHDASRATARLVWERWEGTRAIGWPFG